MIDRFMLPLSVPVGAAANVTVPGIFNLSTVTLGFQVICSPNFYGPECAIFCVEDCTCPPGFTGEFCATPVVGESTLVPIVVMLALILAGAFLFIIVLLCVCFRRKSRRNLGVVRYVKNKHSQSVKAGVVEANTGIQVVEESTTETVEIENVSIS